MSFLPKLCQALQADGVCCDHSTAAICWLMGPFWALINSFEWPRQGLGLCLPDLLLQVAQCSVGWAFSLCCRFRRGSLLQAGSPLSSCPRYLHGRELA